MQRGWIKLYRKVFESNLHANQNAFILWIWLLTHATHRPHRQIVGNQAIDLEAGQLVVGRKALAQELRMSEQNIRTALKVLKNAKNLTIKPTNKFSIITIANWALYQSGGDDANQQSNQPLTSTQPAPNHKQEYKNEKKDIRRMTRPSVEDLQLYFADQGCTTPLIKAQAFYDHFQSNGWKVGGKAAMKDWQAAVRNWLRRHTDSSESPQSSTDMFKGYANHE